MIIAALQFELAIHGAESLKDKRRVVRSLKDRLHREHLVAVAEVGALESPVTAVMGLAAVGTDGRHLGTVLDSVEHKLRGLFDAELVAVRREFIRGTEPDEPTSFPASSPAASPDERADERADRPGVREEPWGGLGPQINAEMLDYAAGFDQGPELDADGPHGPHWPDDDESDPGDAGGAGASGAGGGA